VAITVDDEETGATTFELQEELTGELDVRDAYVYDVWVVDADGNPRPVVEGVWNVRATVTRSVDV
jgi:hypothetical protein